MVRLSNVTLKLVFKLLKRCQEVIELLGQLLPTLLKLNTIPLIFHQEPEKDAKKGIQSSKDLNVNLLPYCKTSRELQKAVGVGTASIGSHMEAMVKGDMVGLVLGKKKRTLSIPVKVQNPLSQFGVVIIENGQIKKKIVYSTLHKRIDFGLFLNDIGNSFVSTESIVKAQQYFPNVQIGSNPFESLEKVEIKEEEMSLREKILSDELGRFYFKAHATNEFSVENILIIEETLNMKSMSFQKDFKKEEQFHKLIQIYETFLNPKSAIMQVNITETLAKEIKDLIETLKEKGLENHENLNDVLDEVVQDVKANCLSDTFSRFLQSRYYEEYTKGTSNAMTYLI
jgi:hypothetical protein